MASLNGVMSPPSNADSTNSSITLSAKRKRDDSIEAQNHINGIGDSKSEEPTGASAEESHALIHDLIDVLKA